MTADLKTHSAADVVVALLVWAFLEEDIIKAQRSENLETSFTVIK